MISLTFLGHEDMHLILWYEHISLFSQLPVCHGTCRAFLSRMMVQFDCCYDIACAGEIASFHIEIVTNTWPGFLEWLHHLLPKQFALAFAFPHRHQV